MACSLALLPCLFVLLCASSLLVDGASVRVVFNRVATCPSAESLAQLNELEAALDQRTCFVACALAENCSALHRRSKNCYFGSGDEFSRLFNLTAPPNSSDSCESYAKDMAGALKEKLVLLFDFRQGFSNLVNPGTYDATPHRYVSRDSLGAHFPGSNDGYIEVDTDRGRLVADYLNQPSDFSFFAKVARQTRAQSTYHYFYNCSSTDSAGRFGDRTQRAWIEHKFPSQALWSAAAVNYQSVPASFIGNSTLQPVSLGAAFHGKTLVNFYLNGSHLAAEPGVQGTTDPMPRCLRLGYDKSESNALRGLMTCYAIAKAALTVEEFQQLDQMCL